MFWQLEVGAATMVSECQLVIKFQPYKSSNSSAEYSSPTAKTTTPAASGKEEGQSAKPPMRRLIPAQVEE